MNDLLDNPAVQAAVLPFVAALLLALPLARTRFLVLASGSGVVLLLALTIGFTLVPLTAVRKMIVLVLAATVLALAIEAAGVGLRRATAAGLSLAAALASLWVLLRILEQAEAVAAWRIAFGAALFVLTLAGSMLAASGNPLRASVIGVALGWGSGALAVLGASALLGQLGIAIGTACAAVALAQMVRGAAAPAGWTVVLPAAVGAPLIGVLAVATGELKAYLLLPLLLVVPAVWLVPAGTRKPWQQASLQGLAALLPVIVAIGWAWFDATSATAGR
jgi:hypothetical protein